MLLLFFHNNPTPPFWAPVQPAAGSWRAAGASAAVWTPVPAADGHWAAAS
ncbi:MAG: hypothetical protein ACOY3L_03665 [Pseudomonadota bacterium]